MEQRGLRSLDNECMALSASLAEIGGRAEQLLADAIGVIATRDLMRADEAQHCYEAIRLLHESIDMRVRHVLALYHPLAGDLTFLLSVIRANAILMRVARLAYKSCKRGIVLTCDSELPARAPFLEMAGLAQQQLGTALDAFLKADLALAQEVRRREKAMDALFHAITIEISTGLERLCCADERLDASQIAGWLFIAKRLEQIGDHASALAEQVGYMAQTNIK